MKEPTRQQPTATKPEHIDLRELGIDEQQAAELRARLSTSAEDWESPEMDIYDNYDAARVKLERRPEAHEGRGMPLV